MTTPELLAHLARDHGLNQRGKQTAADVLQVKTLLRAATRLDPTLTQATTALYELALLAGDDAGAADLLQELVAADPSHQGAFERWLETGAARRQTVEERVEWLQSVAERPDLPLEMQSMVSVALAGLAVQQLDRVRARQLLEQALETDPANPDAILLRLELIEENDPPHVRVGAALAALRANPLRVDAAWRVGVLLDMLGFTAEAAEFYEYALAVHRAEDPNAPIPGGHLLVYAKSWLARGELEKAARYAELAAQADAGLVEARIYQHWLLQKMGKTRVADGVRETLGRRFALIRDPSEWPVGIVAQAAWFHCIVDPQPQRALMLAEAASRRAGGDRFVIRVLGWAQGLNLREEEARRTLVPIAGRDPYATVQLGKLLRDAGDTDAPARLGRHLAHPPVSGPAYELLVGLGALPETPVPAARRFPRAAEALADFDRAVLGFYADATRFLRVTVRMDDPSPGAGEPWWAVISLTNRGSFPITLGPDWMVNPTFLLSFRVEGDRERKYDHLLTLDVDHIRVIRPGRTVRIRRTIGVGPLRGMSRATPQHLQTVSMTALFDPEQYAPGAWRASATGRELPAIHFNRLPADAGRAALEAYFAALPGESERRRFRAVEVFAELLGEKQRADLKRLRYTPQAIPTERIQQALLSSLNSDSWELRVRTLDALQAAGLDAQLFRAAQACLEHEHWLVRLFAVRLLARQGRAFATTAAQIAARDADELVREIARSYLLKWRRRAPASAPASQPTSSGLSGGR